MMIGRIYLERGQPVTVLRQWKGNGPRNVLIRRHTTGEIVVRPARGLRKHKALAAHQAKYGLSF